MLRRACSRPSKPPGRLFAIAPILLLIALPQCFSRYLLESSKNSHSKKSGNEKKERSSKSSEAGMLKGETPLSLMKLLQKGKVYSAKQEKLMKKASKKEKHMKEKALEYELGHHSLPKGWHDRLEVDDKVSFARDKHYANDRTVGPDLGSSNGEYQAIVAQPTFNPGVSTSASIGEGVVEWTSAVSSERQAKEQAKDDRSQAGNVFNLMLREARSNNYNLRTGLTPGMHDNPDSDAEDKEKKHKSTTAHKSSSKHKSVKHKT